MFQAPVTDFGCACCCFVSFNPCLFLLCLNITSFLLNSVWQSGQFSSILCKVLWVTSCWKDGRITELFTECSHHRNLSINQNLYFSKDPTQSRNCQYMILFNNPYIYFISHYILLVFNNNKSNCMTSLKTIISRRLFTFFTWTVET